MDSPSKFQLSPNTWLKHTLYMWCFINIIKNQNKTKQNKNNNKNPELKKDFARPWVIFLLYPLA